MNQLIVINTNDRAKNEHYPLATNRESSRSMEFSFEKRPPLKETPHFRGKVKHEIQGKNLLQLFHSHGNDRIERFIKQHGKSSRLTAYNALNQKILKRIQSKSS